VTKIEPGRDATHRGEENYNQHRPSGRVLHVLGERCLVTQKSILIINARKKWTIRVGVAELES
jgi:hypothetical protein